MAMASSNLNKIITSLIILVLFSVPVSALTISVSGATAYSQDSTTSTNVTVYAGYALPTNCDTRDGSTTCNSCNGKTVTNATSGLTSPAPCNEKSIYGSLTVTFTVNSDKTDISGLPVAASKSTTVDGRYSTISETTVDGKSYSITTTWDVLIAAMASGDSSTSTFNITNCTANCGGTKTFYIGPYKNSEFVEKIAVTVVLSYIDTGNIASKATANVCLPAEGTLTSSTTSEGFCYYEMVPGDEKAYITNNIPGWSTSPKNPDSGVAYSQVVMFYTEKPDSQTATEALKSIKNNSSKTMLNITSDAADPLEDYKISGLDNSGVTYCFLSAIKDVTGNIEYFNDIQNAKGTSSIDTSNFETTFTKHFCARPSEVMGVLGDKNCFIATATFGSPLHPYLDILRSFRDKKLLSNSWGQKFVKWYYKNGPIGARWIEEHSYVKPVVRILLMPLIGMSYLSVHHENIFWLISFMFFILILFIIFRKMKFKKTVMTSLLPVIVMMFFFTAHQASANTLVAQSDEFMEEPTTPAPTPNKDLPPNEPPYVKSDDQIEADKLLDSPTPQAQPEQTKIEPIIERPAEKETEELPTTSIHGNKKIAHPNAAKGLYLIDQTTGKYYYRTEKMSRKNQTTSVRIGMIDPPGIEATPDVGNKFTFADMYGDSQLPFLMLDYEWQPFTKFGKLGFILGMGFFTATGNGRFKVDNGIAEAKESYTFIGMPISGGILYRFEFSHRQWVVPFINGGASYYLLGEIRDDGKRPAFLGTPAAYGSGGLMFNITAWDKDIAFTMDREYSISNMWLTAEVKVIKSLNEDIDLSTNFFNLGISVDY